MPDNDGKPLGQFDPILFGKMLGNTETLLGEFRDLKKDLSQNYVTRREHDDTVGRVTKLEEAPKHKRAEKIAILSALFTLIGGGGTLLGVFLHK